MMRRIAVVGDKLDNDGEICDYKGFNFTIGGVGRFAALIGGAAYCPICKTTGYIARDGGPRRMTLGINEIALDQDVVVCACTERPRIHALLSGEAWYDDLIESLGPVSPPSNFGTTKPFALSSEQTNLDRSHVSWFLVRDSETGNPLPNAEYIAKVGDVRLKGKTDANGYAGIESGEEKEVDLHIVFSSPKRSLNPAQGA